MKSLKLILVLLIVLNLIACSSDNNTICPSDDTLIIDFIPSPSPDIISYNFYVESVPKLVSLHSEYYNLGLATKFDVYKLGINPGTYNIGIGAVTDTGQESKLSIGKKPIVILMEFNKQTNKRRKLV